jgi:hypothetical protein
LKTIFDSRYKVEQKGDWNFAESKLQKQIELLLNAKARLVAAQAAPAELRQQHHDAIIFTSR